MLRLTTSYGYILVAPEQIVFIEPFVYDDKDAGCDVITLEHRSIGRKRVAESALDVARLKAAWERRYTVKNIAEWGELPIAVGMEGEDIRFTCCKRTSELNRAARAEAGDTDPPLKDIVAREVEMAAVQDFQS